MGAVRAVEPLHLRLLRLLRDNGAVSRAELADRLEMPRPRLLAELERLVSLGYVAEAGLAASRGGRRSTLVELSPKLRFAAVDLGASSIDVGYLLVVTAVGLAIAGRRMTTLLCK